GNAPGLRLDDEAFGAEARDVLEGWLSQYKQTAGYYLADFDLDTDVDETDFLIWLASNGRFVYEP
ncbi:MAG: hypothetical protein AAF752_06570, partial [Bacteroidota bacterium]